jgi:hypothetical protein
MGAGCRGMTAKQRRQNHYRQRRRANLVLLPVPIDEFALANALIESGRLSIADALDRRRVSQVVSQLLADFTQRWPADHYAARIHPDVSAGKTR